MAGRVYRSDSAEAARLRLIHRSRKPASKPTSKPTSKLARKFRIPWQKLYKAYEAQFASRPWLADAAIARVKKEKARLNVLRVRRNPNQAYAVKREWYREHNKKYYKKNKEKIKITAQKWAKANRKAIRLRNINRREAIREDRLSTERARRGSKASCGVEFQRSITANLGLGLASKEFWHRAVDRTVDATYRYKNKIIPVEIKYSKSEKTIGATRCIIDAIRQVNQIITLYAFS